VLRVRFHPSVGAAGTAMAGGASEFSSCSLDTTESSPEIDPFKLACGIAGGNVARVRDRTANLSR
jgi:hypothetical protein